MKLERINYSDLNANAQELYNFHKVAAVLAHYGYPSMWLSNDCGDTLRIEKRNLLLVLTLCVTVVMR